MPSIYWVNIISTDYKNGYCIMSIN